MESLASYIADIDDSGTGTSDRERNASIEKPGWGLESDVFWSNHWAEQRGSYIADTNDSGTGTGGWERNASIELMKTRRESSSDGDRDERCGASGNSARFLGPRLTAGLAVTRNLHPSLENRSLESGDHGDDQSF